MSPLQIIPGEPAGVDAAEPGSSAAAIAAAQPATDGVTTAPATVPQPAPGTGQGATRTAPSQGATISR